MDVLSRWVEGLLYSLVAKLTRLSSGDGVVLQTNGWGRPPMPAPMRTELNGVVLPLTLASGLVFPLALFFQGFVAGDFAGDVLGFALHSLPKR